MQVAARAADGLQDGPQASQSYHLQGRPSSWAAAAMAAALHCQAPDWAVWLVALSAVVRHQACAEGGMTVRAVVL